MKVFLDADVLFSASYSMNGASHEVVNHSSVILYTSNECMNEAIRALKKYDKSLDPIFFEKIKIVNVTKKDALEHYIYVFDLSDAHVVAGAVKSKANILTSFNIKDFKSDLIYKDLGVSILKPGEMLSYQRNILV